MPLTPQDVSNKRFTPVRLREGYDMGEVDQFLDEVEAELARLTKENDDLRTQLSSAQTGGTSPATATSTSETTGASPATSAAAATPAPAASEATQQTPAEPVSTPTTTSTQPAASGTGAEVHTVAQIVPGAAAVAAGAQTLRVETVPQASNAAARLLEIATRNADELVETAKNDADKIIGEARTKAERLDSESKGKNDQLESEARNRAQMLDSETGQRRQQLFGDLERDRDKLGSEVENLRAFEREYRSRLKSYFQQQLESLAAAGDTPAATTDQQPAPPKRLRSILGDEEA